MFRDSETNKVTILDILGKLWVQLSSLEIIISILLLLGWDPRPSIFAWVLVKWNLALY